MSKRQKDDADLNGTQWYAEYDPKGHVVVLDRRPLAEVYEPMTPRHRTLPVYLVCASGFGVGNRVYVVPIIGFEQITNWLARHGWIRRKNGDLLTPMWELPGRTQTNITFGRQETLDMGVFADYGDPARTAAEYYERTELLADVHHLPRWQIICEMLDALTKER
jgi:hypothetical protein